jgi:hypothetical protein
MGGGCITTLYTFPFSSRLLLGVCLLSVSPASNIKKAAQHFGYSVSTLRSARPAVLDFGFGWMAGWLDWTGLDWTGKKKTLHLTCHGGGFVWMFLFFLCPRGSNYWAGNIKLFT